MSGIRIYGASFLEALAITICQSEPERVWLTLGPREVILKQIVESIQPDLAVQMVPAQRIRELSFESGSAYVLSERTETFEGLASAVLRQPARLLVLLCDEPQSLEKQFRDAGIAVQILDDCSDLASELRQPPPLTGSIYLTAPAAVKTAGDLIINWTPKQGFAGSQNQLGAGSPMTAKPKVLVIAPFLPYPLNSGSRIRIYESLNLIGKFAEITLASIYYSYLDLAALFHLRERFGEVIAARLVREVSNLDYLPRVIAEFTSPYMEHAIQEALIRLQPDLIHLDTTYPGAYAHLAGSIPLLLEEHNIEYDVIFRSGLREEYQPLKDFEQDLWRMATHIIAVTQRDRQIMAETIPIQKTSLLPNGVNTSYFQPPENPGELKFVFIGTLDYPPNQQAIKNFYEFVWPDLRSRKIPWYVIGSGVPNGLDFVHNDPQIKFLHDAPDVRPYLDSNAIMVVPLQVGGGSRLKILTALAMGCPVVSTSLGCEGLEVLDGEHVLIADTPEAMLQMVNRLIDDPPLRLMLSQNGRCLAEKSYDWGIVLQPLQSIYKNLLA